MSTFDVQSESGWSFLVVTQPKTTHQPMCVLKVSACVLLYQIFETAAHLSNQLIFFTDYRHGHYKSQLKKCRYSEGTNSHL